MATDYNRLDNELAKVDQMLVDARLALSVRLTLNKLRLPAIKTALELVSGASDKLLDLEVELED